MAMALLADFRFVGQDGKSADGKTTAVLAGVTPGSGGAIGLNGWHVNKDAIVLDASSSIAIPIGGVMGAEFALNPAALDHEANLLSGPGSAIALTLLPAAGGAAVVRATVNLAGGPVHVEATDTPLAVGAWASISAVFTGDELVLSIRGAVVRRRVLQAAIAAPTTTGLVIGATPDGLVAAAPGHLAGVRLWDGVPGMMEEALDAARAAGLGEIDSRWEDLGGAAGWVGAPTADEQAIGAGRVRPFAGATLAWHPEVGTHEVHGAIRDLWNQFGGAAGFLDYPQSDELDADAYFTVIKSILVPGGLIPQEEFAHVLAADALKNVVVAGGVADAAAVGAAHVEPQLNAEIAGGVHGAGLQAAAHAAALDAAPVQKINIDPGGVPGVIGGAAHAGAGGGGDGNGDGGMAGAIVSPVGELHGALDQGIAGIVAATTTKMSRFRGGSIVWSADTGAHEIHGEILVRWLLAGGTKGFMGRPLSNEEDEAPGGRHSIFEGATVLWSPGTGAHEIHGGIREFHATHGGSGGLLGFPLTDETAVIGDDGKPLAGRLNRFAGATVYWSPATGAHEVHGAIRELYEKAGGPRSALGYPVTDETGVVNNDIRYNDFEHGVIVWSPTRGAQLINTLTVKFDKATAPSIDDGIEWDLSKDHDAEMYTFTTVRRDGVAVPGWDNLRTPSSGHGGKTLQLPTEEVALGEIRAGTRIQLDLRAMDWDAWPNADDALGSLSVDYGIETWWGTANDGGISVLHATGGDGTVDYDVGIGSPSTGDPGPAAMREKGWWAFENFSSPRLSRALYTETFLDVEANENWWDTVTNPLDALFYEIAYKGVASHGNCFGMSQEARRAVQGHSAFREPLSQYTLPGIIDPASENQVNPTWRHSINRAHGGQLGAAALGWFLGRLGDLSAVSPATVYDRVRNFVHSGDRPVISMMSLSDFSGHAVLAYDVADGNPNTIFVCDPNVAFATNANRAASRIEVHPDNTFQFFNNGAPHPKYHSSTIAAGLLPGTLMVEIPSFILDQPVRTPIWDIVIGLIGAFGSLILIGGDADGTQITGDGASFYGAPLAVSPKVKGHLIEALGEEAATKVELGKLKGFTQLHAVAAGMIAKQNALKFGAAHVAGAADLEPGHVDVVDAGPVIGALHISPISPAAGGAFADVPVEKFAGLAEKIGPIVLASLLEPQIRPNSIPGMARMPFLDVEDPPELFLKQGALPADLKIDWAARGSGALQTFIRSARTAVGIGGSTVASQIGAMRIDAVGRSQPLIHLETNQAATSMTVDYVVQQDESGRESRRMRADLPVGSGAPTTFGPAEGLGVVIDPGIQGPPVQLRVESRIDGQHQSVAVSLPGLDATDRLVVRPADLGSPLGAQILERTTGVGGDLVSKTVVNPSPN
jgi:hypothetical protein